MKRILITGSMGQIGTELTEYLRAIYGKDNVIATGRRFEEENIVVSGGTFELLDAHHGEKMNDLVKKYKVDTIMHLSAILSAVGEKDPMKAWDTNMNTLFNALEVARENKCAIFLPSTIGVFGGDYQKDLTPQDTIQRPETIYGITKVAAELLCDYYFMRYGVDARGVRFPGLISSVALPGGGTTDYAVHIYYEALKNKEYECFIKEGTFMDMLYMPDALKSIVDLMEADPAKLKHRNAYNVTAMSCAPEDFANEIKKHIPEFKINYKVDPVRQAIAESWPNFMDTTAAREEFGFKPEYDLEKMTIDMLEKLKNKK